VLLAFFAAKSLGAEERCTKSHHPTGDYWMTWKVAREKRAYFYSAPASNPATPKRLKSFMIRGDLVGTFQPSYGSRDEAARTSPFVCAFYLSSDGSGTYGWLRKTDLLAVGGDEGNGLGQEESEPSSALKELLSQLRAVDSWPAAGVTPDPCYHERGFVGDFLCVERIDLERKELCVLTTHRWNDPAECGKLSLGNRCAAFENEGWYFAYLFNNGIAVVSETGKWGNHGQSDPSGVFVFADSARRACAARGTAASPRGSASRALCSGAGCARSGRRRRCRSASA